MRIWTRTHFVGLLFLSYSILPAQSFPPRLFTELRWREIGPYRGGRTRALAGVPDQPNVFYIAAVNGGVWTTNDYGHTWRPIFDHEDTGSIGALAVAPSDPNIVYAGSGEGLQRPDLSTGDGIYKSTDGGGTWTHLGLRDGQQIPQLAIDPRDPNHVFAAVLGHPYGPNPERGLYRSLDGGQTFTKVLYKDENTGANDVKIDPKNPDVMYASLWEARQGPWENAAWSGTNGGIFKSTDGGEHWRPLTKGLPAEGVVQANIAISPGKPAGAIAPGTPTGPIAPSEPARVFAAVATTNGTGIYRSDDAGESWTKITDDNRPAARIGGGDLPVPVVDPKNSDVVFSCSTVVWKSVDGGKTWSGIRGAPGGDDYQGMWINPSHPEIKLLVSDQGAIVTVNDGETWTDWYNQPTAQMYHVAADNSFPYRVCGGQQESGSACVASRGNDGEITFRDWRPVGVEEYGNAVPDPTDAEIVYGGKVTRFDRRTTQVQNVGPKPVRPPDYRTLRTAPLVFSPLELHTLYFGSNTLWKTENGGQSWQQISPDLTRKTWPIPASVGKYRDAQSAQPTQRGVIYAIAPSPLDVKRIWAGTDDGLVQLTSDAGATWKDVTPKQLTPWQKISIIDAGHFDRATAYVAVNAFRLDDLRPHVYRTHDGGATWTEIVNGLPNGAAINVVREDPKRKGLLFAGSERAVYVSFDDGDDWQSLRNNMPATSIRDLLVKDDDLIAATHGRGFWILDDISPLRQLTQAAVQSEAYLFKPETAVRVRWDTNTDTPLPPDIPAGKNPRDGAVIDYLLGAGTHGEVTLEIYDKSSRLIRRYASSDPVPAIDPHLAIPKYWVRPPQRLSNEPGLHRFMWDMHYTPLAGGREEYPMQAVFEDTAPQPNSPWVIPGTYLIKLTGAGKTVTQPITIRMDPRVRTPWSGLEEQFTLSKQIYDDLIASDGTLKEIDAFREHAAQQHNEALEKKAATLEGEAGRRGRNAPAGPDSFRSVTGSLTALLRRLQEADAAPTQQLRAAVAERRAALAKLRREWAALQASEGNVR
jgi:photosystem II stability/assembly factor-like uncharacterized protein